MSRIVRWMVGAVGLAAVGFAAALSVAPEAVAGAVPVGSVLDGTALSETAARTAAVVALGAVCSAWISWTSGAADRRPAPASDGFERLREEPPERASPSPVVGARFDRRLARSADGPEGGAVRPTVRSLAVRAVAAADGCEESTAERRVESGEWTEDPVAAAYVADRESALPFRYRLRAWLRPEWTRAERVERALAAIERRQEGR